MPRDPGRIDNILFLLSELWKKNPDWRLGQLVSNIQGPGKRDVFYMEDDEWESLIKHRLTKGWEHG